MKLRNIPFSPPDKTEAEAKLASEAILSGWITTGPKTKEFERQIAAYVGTKKAVCLNSATAAMEMALRLIGVGPNDEVIVPFERRFIIYINSERYLFCNDEPTIANLVDQSGKDVGKYNIIELSWEGDYNTKIRSDYFDID